MANGKSGGKDTPPSTGGLKVRRKGPSWEWRAKRTVFCPSGRTRWQGAEGSMKILNTSWCECDLKCKGMSSVARLTRFEGRGHKKVPKGPPFAYVFWKNFKNKLSKGFWLFLTSPSILRGGGGMAPWPPPLNAPLHVIHAIQCTLWRYNAITAVLKCIFHQEFLPKSNNFFKFFLRNDLEWFITSWYLRNLDSIFLFRIQEKKVKSKWIRWTTRKSVLVQTQDTFLAHTLDTQFFELIVWLTGVNGTGRSAVCTGWFTGTFIPYFITDLDQSHSVSRTMVFAFS